MHIPHALLTLTLLTTSSLALTPRAHSHQQPSFAAMLRRGSAIAKRQGYYPSSDVCNGPGSTCASACGAEYVECPSDGSVTSCHSTTDGSHCCTDGTGNACGPGDYCTHDNRGQTYCCPENLNAEECAKQLGLDEPLIPDSAATPTTPPVAEETAVVPSPSAVLVSSSSPSPLPSPSPSPSPSSSTTRPSSTRTTAEPSASLPTVASSSSSSRLPNATSTSPGLPQFTGGAAKMAGAGAVAFAAVAGLVIL
ncbi:hypothetical protein J3E72DRAFT_410159 [Bipolaris maydis]|nr:hypothetical protein J3E72DRAFT_410159 [Bipolaris maydis]